MNKLAQFEISKGIKAAWFPSFLQLILQDHSVFSSSSHSAPSVLVRQLASNILAFPVNLLLNYSNIKLTATTCFHLHHPILPFTSDLSSPRIDKPSHE